MTAFSQLLRILTESGVEFIVVGGVAGVAHGSSRVTQDLDVVYRRNDTNLSRIVATLAPFGPYPRGAPPGLPFQWDDRTVRMGSNFTLATSLGYIDLRGEITGGGTYSDLLPHTVQLEVFGITCACVDLDTLIRVKYAAGRPKDFDAVAELNALRQEKAREDA